LWWGGGGLRCGTALLRLLVIENVSQLGHSSLRREILLKDVERLGHERLALRLYRTHRETLLSYAGKLSGDRAAAEDIVQDAWMLLDRQTDATAIHEPLGYLRRIIRNLVFAQVRRQSRESLWAAEDMPDIADDRPSVEAELIARQTMELVLDTIDAMPARQKAAIKMYHFEGLKLREIAERLELSVSYTHSLIIEGMEICNQRRRQGL